MPSIVSDQAACFGSRPRLSRFVWMTILAFTFLII